MKVKEEVRRRVYRISTSVSGTSVPNVAAAISAAVSDVTNTYFFATRFACRRKGMSHGKSRESL